MDVLWGKIVLLLFLGTLVEHVRGEDKENFEVIKAELVDSNKTEEISNDEEVIEKMSQVKKRSIGNIMRLLFGGNVPPNHPLVKNNEMLPQKKSFRIASSIINSFLPTSSSYGVGGGWGMSDTTLDKVQDILRTKQKLIPYTGQVIGGVTGMAAVKGEILRQIQGLAAAAITQAANDAAGKALASAAAAQAVTNSVNKVVNYKYKLKNALNSKPAYGWKPEPPPAVHSKPTYSWKSEVPAAVPHHEPSYGEAYYSPSHGSKSDSASIHTSASESVSSYKSPQIQTQFSYYPGTTSTDSNEQSLNGIRGQSNTASSPTDLSTKGETASATSAILSSLSALLATAEAAAATASAVRAANKNSEILHASSSDIRETGAIPPNTREGVSEPGFEISFDSTNGVSVPETEYPSVYQQWSEQSDQSASSSSYPTTSLSSLASAYDQTAAFGAIHSVASPNLVQSSTSAPTIGSQYSSNHAKTVQANQPFPSYTTKASSFSYSDNTFNSGAQEGYSQPDYSKTSSNYETQPATYATTSSNIRRNDDARNTNGVHESGFGNGNAGGRHPSASRSFDYEAFREEPDENNGPPRRPNQPPNRYRGRGPPSKERPSWTQQSNRRPSNTGNSNRNYFRGSDGPLNAPNHPSRNKNTEFREPNNRQRRPNNRNKFRPPVRFDHPKNRRRNQNRRRRPNRPRNPPYYRNEDQKNSNANKNQIKHHVDDKGSYEYDIDDDYEPYDAIQEEEYSYYDDDAPTRSNENSFTDEQRSHDFHSDNSVARDEWKPISIKKHRSKSNGARRPTNKKRRRYKQKISRPSAKAPNERRRSPSTFGKKKRRRNRNEISKHVSHFNNNRDDGFREQNEKKSDPNEIKYSTLPEWILRNERIHRALVENSDSIGEKIIDELKIAMRRNDDIELIEDYDYSDQTDGSIEIEQRRTGKDKDSKDSDSQMYSLYLYDDDDDKDIDRIEYVSDVDLKTAKKSDFIRAIQSYDSASMYPSNTVKDK